ncbi:MAG: YlmH/Sll1252 family protein, partial [Oscillospiraceae bacterium]
MGKISFLNPDNDEKILAGRIEDLALLAEKGRAGFSNFLNIRQREIAAAALSGFDCKVLYYGGFHDAERSVLGLSPSFRELEEWDFPIEAVTFKWNKSFSLSHRDILGTLMSLGIERWAFGDILMDEGKATVFLLKSISGNVVREVTKIGNVGVSGEISRKEEIEVK